MALYHSKSLTPSAMSETDEQLKALKLPCKRTPPVQPNLFRARVANKRIHTVTFLRLTVTGKWSLPHSSKAQLRRSHCRLRPHRWTNSGLRIRMVTGKSRMSSRTVRHATAQPLSPLTEHTIHCSSVKQGRTAKVCPMGQRGTNVPRHSSAILPAPAATSPAAGAALQKTWSTRTVAATAYTVGTPRRPEAGCRPPSRSTARRAGWRCSMLKSPPQMTQSCSMRCPSFLASSVPCKPAR
mmetsp:Transcript_7172/g.19927  ORF Transcript_7172/g.19927 Transcript_7172/m.19927 type:complete len:239 (-) Transcript_7172:622-1338(-)